MEAVQLAVGALAHQRLNRLVGGKNNLGWEI